MKAGRSASYPSPALPAPAERIDGTSGLSAALIGQQVPVSVGSAGRLEKWKNTHLIGRLGIGSGEELHAIPDQSCHLSDLKDGPLITNSDLFLWVL